MAVTVDDETLQSYIMESKEHLADIESDLLEIEQQGEHCDKDQVNKVFRAAHSIKGGAGFLGLVRIKELSHKIENILDMIRNSQMIPSDEIVSTLLAAFDHLGKLLDNCSESDSMDIAGQVAALESLIGASLPKEDKETIYKEVNIGHPNCPQRFTITEFDLAQSRKCGKILYILSFDLLRDVHRQNKTPLDLVQLLEDGGEILEVAVGIMEVGDLESSEIMTKMPMYVLYASIIEPDLMARVMSLTKDNVHVVTDVAVPVAPSVAPAPSAIASAPKPVKPAKSVKPVKPAESVKSTKIEEPSKPDVPAPPAKAAKTAAIEVPVEKTPSAPSCAASSAEQSAKKEESATDTLRVNVSILDQLMNRAGELVLARNQLIQALSTWDRQNIAAAAQRLDLVTSELQESIMLTRMQPVANIFNKFPRVVRDLARMLRKEVNLELEGKNVDLDKTIIEGLGDPLTHLVRNSVDHGIESPEERTANGKPAIGYVLLRALHESGQVVIEIHDDGRGIDPEKIARKAVEKGAVTKEQAAAMSRAEKLNLILLPGLSTAEAITEVSGRGVGMDVVKTNLDRLGGQVEINSEVGRGTVIRIKLPLTLAIIPSLLVSAGGERFAVPQVNVGELIQIAASEVRERIERIGGAEVLMLRGELIPVVQLAEVLKMTRTFVDPKTGKEKPDRRQRLADERIATGDVPLVALAGEDGRPKAPERRHRYTSSLNIVVVQAGNMKYGMVVDQLHDTVEIVVKPLGRHLKRFEVYAGATIMGDGRVALILDITGLAHTARLRSMEDARRKAQAAVEAARAKESAATHQTLLLFRNGPEEHCAVPLNLVRRVEQIKAADIELRGGKKVIQHHGGHLPLYALEEVAAVESLEAREELIVIIFNVAGHEVGLLAVPPVDVIDTEIVVDRETLKQPGISGSSIVRGKTTMLVDISGFMETLNPQWFEEKAVSTGNGRGRFEGYQSGRPLLLAEDSPFFRDQVKKFLEDDGFSVITAADGMEAWKYLDTNPAAVELLVTDIEMPNMDGIALTRRVRADDRFRRLPIVALTTLASDEDMARGKAAGIDDYQVKLDREQLVKGIKELLGGK